MANNNSSIKTFSMNSTLITMMMKGYFSNGNAYYGAIPMTSRSLVSMVKTLSKIYS